LQGAHSEGGNVVGERRDAKVLRKKLGEGGVETSGEYIVGGVIGGDGVCLAIPGLVGEREEVGDGVISTGDVLGKQAVMVVQHECGGLAGNHERGVSEASGGADVCGVEEAADGSGVIANGQVAAVGGVGVPSFVDEEPEGDEHGEEFENVVDAVVAI